MWVISTRVSQQLAATGNKRRGISIMKQRNNGEGGGAAASKGKEEIMKENGVKAYNEKQNRKAAAASA